MRILFSIVLIISFAACNPVKKVLQSPTMTERVVVEYLKANPPKTQTFYLPGKDTTIIKDTIIYDSIRLPYPVNHRYTEIRYVDKLVRDTIRIVDRSLDSLYIRKINALEAIVSELQADNKDMRKEIWTWRIVAAIAFILLMLAVFKLFR
jgi:pyoverdine/dityrosine biosynthesis protein Dit1